MKHPHPQDMPQAHPKSFYFAQRVNVSKCRCAEHPRTDQRRDSRLVQGRSRGPIARAASKPVLLNWKGEACGSDGHLSFALHVVFLNFEAIDLSSHSCEIADFGRLQAVSRDWRICFELISLEVELRHVEHRLE